jgi:hypothetical protein
MIVHDSYLVASWIITKPNATDTLTIEVVDSQLESTANYIDCVYDTVTIYNGK